MIKLWLFFSPASYYLMLLVLIKNFRRYCPGVWVHLRSLISIGIDVSRMETDPGDNCQVINVRSIYSN